MKLLPCKYCGDTPEVRSCMLWSEIGFLVLCENIDCPEEPSEVSMSRDIAEERWNMHMQETCDQPQGCGACGDGCSGRSGGCRLAEESPPITPEKPPQDVPGTLGQQQT